MASLVRFGGFEVDLAAGRLFKHGLRIHLREQSFQVRWRCCSSGPARW